ncbi:hypothetical protein SD77_2583 [Bacillus badius]|uniref:Mobile element protein n=1 Tax=Bacillus badius TaxID=1455 RepID=A0ABR5AZI0_BACBA|nr:hypothetical protein SD77_2583 [Bacillus badius]
MLFFLIYKNIEFFNNFHLMKAKGVNNGLAEVKRFCVEA